MAYIPTEWQTGDIVTADKLNKIENGIENAIELPSVTAGDDGDVLTVVEGAWAKAEPSSPFVFINHDDIGDYTYADIEAYYLANKIVVIRDVYTDPNNWHEYNFRYLFELVDPTLDGEEPGIVGFFNASGFLNAITSENNKTSPLVWGE